MVLAAHGLEAMRARPRRKGPGGDDAALLLWVALGALAMLFVNPFGWRAVAQPFEYVLGQRHEAIFQSVPELRPLDWKLHLRSLLPLILAGWPLLAVWRWRRSGADLVEAVLLACFVPLPFLSQRFLGFTVVVAAPYLARDLDAWVRGRRWPARGPGRAPAWRRRPAWSAACPSGVGSSLAWVWASRGPPTRSPRAISWSAGA